MALILTDEQKVHLSIQPLTAAGNAAPIDGVPLWSVTDPNIIGLDIAADGISCYAITTGALGTSQINVSADADMGDGIVTLMAILDIQVAPAQAVSLGILAGTPELK